MIFMLLVVLAYSARKDMSDATFYNLWLVASIEFLLEYLGGMIWILS